MFLSELIHLLVQFDRLYFSHIWIDDVMEDIEIHLTYWQFHEIKSYFCMHI